MQRNLLIILAITLAGLAVDGTTGLDTSLDANFEIFKDSWITVKEDFENIFQSRVVLANLIESDSDNFITKIGNAIWESLKTIPEGVKTIWDWFNSFSPSKLKRKLKKIKNNLKKLKNEVVDMQSDISYIEGEAKENGHEDIAEEAAKIEERLKKLLAELKEMCKRASELCKTWCGGDPHATQSIKGSFTPFIYDILGQDGETYQLVNAPTQGLTISATLKSVNVRTFFGKITITFQGVVVELDVDTITVDTEVFDWAQNVVTKPANGETVSVEMASNQVVVSLGPAMFTIRRKNRTNLNLFTYADIPENAGGIIGDMRKNCLISYDENGATLTLTDIDDTTSEIPLENNGSSLRFLGQDVQPFRDLLLRNRV